MVRVDRTRKREMRRDGTNHHEKLGLEGILCASHFNILDTAGTSQDTACNYINTRSSQPNQASRSPDFPDPLVSSTSFSSSSPISLILFHNSTIIAEQKDKSSLSISPCHVYEFTLSTAYTKYSIHQVQHAPSTAYTEYSMHQVQHTPSTAYTVYSTHRVQHTPNIVCLPFILMITSWPLNVASTSSMPPYTINRHHPAFNEKLNGKVTLSHSHCCELPNWWIESQHSACCPSTTSKYSLDYSWPVLTIMASKCISKLARLRPPSLHDHVIEVHCETRSITASECISEFTQSSFPGAPRIALKHCRQPLPILYCV